MANAIERVQQLRQATAAARRELDSLSVPSGGAAGRVGTGPRGATAGDMRGLARGIVVLSGKVDRLGKGKIDPFLADLMRSGPRTV